MAKSLLDNVKTKMCIGLGFSDYTEEGKIPAWFWYYGFVKSVKKVNEDLVVKVKFNDGTKDMTILLKEKNFNEPSNEEPDSKDCRVLGWTIPKTATEKIRDFIKINEEEFERENGKKHVREEEPTLSERPSKKAKKTGQYVTEEQLLALIAHEREKWQADNDAKIIQTFNNREKEQRICDIWKMVTPISTVSKDDQEIYKNFWPEVRDGARKFPKLKGSRICCSRYRHISGSKSACCSAVMTPDTTGVMYLLNKNAAYVPVAAITMDDAIKKKMDNPSVTQAHKIWMKYRMCKSCADKMVVEGLSYIKFQNTTDVFPHCVMCLDKNGSEHSCNGLLKMCKTCFDKVGRDGNSDGDDWTNIMKPIAQRNMGLEVEWKKTMPGKLGQAFEPDTVFVIKLTGKELWVIIEEDGCNQHSNNAEATEYTRMLKIIKSVLSKKEVSILFIRFSPKGGYKTGLLSTSYNIDKSLRLLVVRQWVIWGISKMKEGVLPRLCLLYMFFDYNNKHYLKAKTTLRSDLRNIPISIGFGYTWPQDIVIPDGEIDFRYALTINEGTVMQKLGSITGLLKLSVLDIVTA